MTKKEKQEIILAIAMAYYRRGKAIQYNQLSMDRVARVTPRRQRGIAPEYATMQHTCFLDCSSFVWTVYHEAFGLDLPSDLTWYMTKLEEYRTFYYELTHQETDEEREKIIEQLHSGLEPGDLIVYAKERGTSGHVMLYIGDEKFVHCCWAPDGGDYDYVEMRNRMRLGGGIEIGDLKMLFCKWENTPETDRSLFQPTKKCFCILRPLDAVNEPVENTKLRMAYCRDVDFFVYSSVYGGRIASSGDEICYTLAMKNTGTEEKALAVSFAPPQGTSLLNCGAAKVRLPAGSEQKIDFRVQVEDAEAPLLEAPIISANGFQIIAPCVILGKRPAQTEIATLLYDFSNAFTTGENAFEAAAQAYQKRGIILPRDERAAMSSLFVLIDAASGDVLYRKEQQPEKDLAAYAQFGGTGVITPEIIQNGCCRTQYISKEDLIPGDMILVADDALYAATYACFYDGEALYGAFTPDGKAGKLQGEKMNRYIDSLFGRFAFAVLRPFLGA